MTEDTKINEVLNILSTIHQMDLHPTTDGDRVTMLLSDRIVTFKHDDVLKSRNILESGFRNKPVGTIMIFTNYRGDVLEIIKDGKHLFDTIEHLEDGQDRTCGISPSLVLSEFFRGEYDLNTMRMDDQILEDPAPITNIRLKRFVEKDADSVMLVGYRITETYPDGTVTSEQQVI